jgi:hypothetical protein
LQQIAVRASGLGVGVEESPVDEQDVGDERRQHDGDAEAGDLRRGVVSAAADDNVAWDDDEKLGRLFF